MLKVTGARGALCEALQIVSRGVSGRSTQPVQNNIYLEARGETLRVVATDLEHISIEAQVDVSVSEEGAVTAPARLLAEVSKSLPAEDVTLGADDSQALTVECGKSNYTIRGLSAADFQMFPPAGEGLRVSVPQAQLARLLRQTVFAASNDAVRTILCGALVSFSEGTLQVVATDTFRLARGRMEWGDGNGGGTAKAGAVQARAGTASAVQARALQCRTAIVSARALNELLRLLGPEEEGMVGVTVTDNQAEFDLGNIKVATRLIEGQYPNYESVIPNFHEKRVTVACAELEASLRRALIVAREDAYRVVLRTEGDTLQISAEIQDVGKVAEEVACRLVGEPVEMAFSCRYLLDVLEALDTEEVNLDVSGPLNPGMVRAEGDGEFLYVVMPMQIM